MAQTIIETTKFNLDHHFKQIVQWRFLFCGRGLYDGGRGQLALAWRPNGSAYISSTT